jgi:hypothetical protein
MRIAVVVLVLAGVSFALPAAAEDDTASFAPRTASGGAGAALAPTAGGGLTGVHGRLTADGTKTAGHAREVELSVTNAAVNGRAVRPAATPRVLRRLGTERVMASLAPGLDACASAAALTAPVSFPVSVAVSPDGTVEATEMPRGARVPSPLVACVVKALGAARFGAPGAAGATVSVPISLAARAAQVTAAAPAAASGAATPTTDDATSPAPRAATAQP